MLNRRHFLRLSAFAGGALLLPSGCAVVSTGPQTKAAAGKPETLVLVEFQGGNDGLNTVAPIKDPLYRSLRPTLALSESDTIPVGRDLALHPALKPAMALWDAGDLAVVLGVGYPNPDRSHFRSIDIWDTASDADRVLSTGWITRALQTQPRQRAADAFVLGRPHLGPVTGSGIKAVSLSNPGTFAKAATAVSIPEMQRRNPILDQISAVQGTLRVAGDDIQNRLKAVPASLTADFPKTNIGGQFADAMRLLAAGVEAPVIKLSLGSFDTHIDQAPQHARLLGDFAAGLAAFRKAAQASGHWDRVILLTYSEFGRRPAENASKGTDHGTAAPQFLAGGAVRGGLIGTQPALDRLQNDDLVHTMDFRQVYAGLLQGMWGIAPEKVFGKPVDATAGLIA